MTPARPRPTVAVVIPCFNQGRYLSTSIASVRAQRYAVDACVVVDDGSTDGTAAVAARLDVPVIRQPNAGVSAARNAGLAAMRTDYVVFLDADDELLPDAIETEVEAFAGHAHVAAVVGRCQSMSADGRPLLTRHDGVDPDRLYREWLRRNFVWTPGAALFDRRALADIGGFPRDLGPAADYAVYLRLAREDRVAYVPCELVRYRQHDASMSGDPALMLRATLGVLRRERRAAPAWAREAIRASAADWRQWYGDQIVEWLRSDVSARRAGPRHWRAALTLLRHCPAMVLRRTAGRSRRAVAWRPSR
jgi:glycosyltransferase involved in cell wall biosynthesis